MELRQPGQPAPPPGSDGDFAIIDSDHYGIGNSQDTSLVSPVVDLSSQTSPEIGFDTDYNGIGGQVGDVDISTDGGTTWTNVWEQTTDDVNGHVDMPYPGCAGQATCRCASTSRATWGWWWIVDNVFVGTRTCEAQRWRARGGHRPGRQHQPADQRREGRQRRAPGRVRDLGGDAGRPGRAGRVLLAVLVADRHDQVPRHRREVHAGDRERERGGRASTTRKNWTLKAGHLTVSPTSLSATVRLGQSANRTVTFGNDGTSPVHVDLGEQSGAFTPMVKGPKGAPVRAPARARSRRRRW